MTIVKVKRCLFLNALNGAFLGSFILIPSSAYSSTGTAVIGRTLFNLTTVTPVVTLGICLLCMIIARVRSQPWAHICAIILGILTVLLACLNLAILKVGFAMFHGLPFIPLLLAINLLLSQFIGPIRIAAGYVLMFIITFFLTYLPQRQEIFLKRFDSTGIEMPELRAINFRFGPVASFNPPAKRVLYNHRLVTSDREKIWFVSQYDGDFKNMRGENFLLHQYNQLTPIWETSVPYWESGQTKASPKVLASDSKGGVFLAGENYAVKTADHTAGGSWWIKRFDENGAEDPKWQLTFRENNLGRGFYVYSLVVGPSESLYVVGGLSRSGGEKGEIQISKFWLRDSAVSKAWSISIPSISGGRTWPPETFDAVSDPAGDLYVLISEKRPSTYQIHGPQRHIYKIKKISGVSGIELWEREAFSTENSKGMTRMSMNKEKLYILGTHVKNKDKEYSPAVKRFNLEGIEDPGWNKLIASPHGRAIATRIAFDGKDNVYLVGFQEGADSKGNEGQWWLKKFSENGSELQEWNKILVEDSTRETISWLTVDNKGNPLVFGEAESFVPAFLEKIVLK